MTHMVMDRYMTASPTPNLYGSHDTTIAQVLKELGLDLPCQAVSASGIRETLRGRTMTYHETIFEPQDAVTGWRVGDDRILCLNSRGWAWYIKLNSDEHSGFSSRLYYHPAECLETMLQGILLDKLQAAKDKVFP